MQAVALLKLVEPLKRADLVIPCFFILLSAVDFHGDTALRLALWRCTRHTWTRGLASLGFYSWNESGEVCEVCDGAKFYSPTSCMKKTSQRADDMSQDRCQIGAPDEKRKLQTGSHWSVSGGSMNVLRSSISSMTIFQRFSVKWMIIFSINIQSNLPILFETFLL